jgi:peptidoglycan/LPS O-acetylase OafA/YrhL
MILAREFPEIHHSEVITSSAMDYFGVGALLAWAMARGMIAGDKRLKWASLLAFIGYAFLYTRNEMGKTVEGFQYIQQTLVAVVFAGLISSTLAGFHGVLGKILDNPAVQHIGRLSFGLYLFHTTAPFLVGHTLPFLWWPFFAGPWQVIRLVMFALTSWGLAYLCWRYLETRPAHPNKHAGASSPDR